MKNMFDLVATLKDSFNDKTPAIMIMAVNGDSIGSKFILNSDNEVIEGTLPTDFSIEDIKLKQIFVSGNTEYYAEMAEKNDEILVLGAGHVSRCIADILEFIDCRVTVVDDRAEFLKPEYFSATVNRVCLDFEKLNTLPLTSYKGIIIVTRAHEFDRVCLRQLRDCLDVYIGIMGSKKRLSHVRQALIKHEGWTVNDVDKIYGPIGLEIGSETPQEIALSIVSEYLSVVRGKWPVVAKKLRG